MADPTEAFRRNPPKDPYRDVRDAFRRHPPGMPAHLAGPGAEPELAAAEEKRTMEAPSAGSAAGPLLETGLSIAMGALPGGMLAERLASGMVSKMGRLGAEILGRGTMAGAGGVLGSEAAAPTNETAEEAQARRNMALGVGAAGEAITPALKVPFNPALTAVRSRLGGIGAKELLHLGAEESQALLMSLGRTLTPAQIRTGKLLQTFENVIGASFGGGQVMDTHARRAEAAAVEHLENVVPGLTKGLSREDAGLALNATLRGEVRLDRAATSAAYRNATLKIVQAGGTGDIVPVKPFVDKAVKRLGVDPKDAGSMEIMSSLRRFGDVDHLTLEQAERLRSDLLAIGRKGEGVLPTPKVFANELAKEVDDTMTVASMSLGRYGPEVVAAVERARAFSKISHKRWDHELVANLMDQVAPEQLPKLILADDNPTQVRMVREVLFDPKYRIGRLDAQGNIIPPIKNPTQTWKSIQSAWLADKGAVGEYGVLQGKTLGSALDASKGTGKELWTQAEREALRKSARALELIQEHGGGREGAIWMQLTQAGAAGALIGFGPSGPETQALSGIIILGPIIPALLLTNPRFSNYMLKLAKSSGQRTGRLTASTAAQTISHLVAENIPFTWKGFDGTTTEHKPDQDPFTPAPPAPTGKERWSTFFKPQSKF